MLSAIIKLLFMIPSPLALLRYYLAQLWIHLSVVRTENNLNCDLKKPKSTFINRTYLVTFILYTIATIHGIFGLHWEGTGSLTGLRNSNFIYWRQFFEQEIGLQTDIVMIALIVSDILLSLDFALKQIPSQYLFTINRAKGAVLLDGKALSIYESTKIIKMFHRSEVVYKLFGLATFGNTVPYCYVLVFTYSEVFTGSFWSFAFWIFGFSYIILIMTLFGFDNLTHVIVSGSCIQIRQQYIYEQFSRMLSKLATPKRLSNLSQIWPRYLTFNRAVLLIGLQLEAFNVFYTNNLTVIFLVYIVIQVMYSYLIFFIPSTTTTVALWKCLFVVFLLETVILLFGLIQFCALVVKKNGQIGKLNRRFAVHCLRGQTSYQLRVRQLLKMETLQWPRLLHFYAFKLFGNARITSKTFYAMAINISAFFLFVIKRMH